MNAVLPAHGELLRDVDAEIAQALARLREQYAVHSATGIVDELAAALLPGGKRMRPLLCLWSYLACGRQLSDEIVKAAASLEFLHTFAILHDDIMDDPAARRRQVPAHARVAGARAETDSPGDPGRYGISVAMLAGDLALVASDQLLSESGFPPAVLAEAWKPLSRMRLDAVAGQYLDLTLSGKHLEPEAAGAIARLKSGSYSVKGPLAVGAALAGAGHLAIRALTEFGEKVGEAFQLADDVLGMFGSPDETGKDVHSDLADGRPTMLVALALQRSSGDAAGAIEAAWSNPRASEAQIRKAKEAILASGALSETVGRIRGLIGDGKEAISAPALKNLEPAPCARLREMADGVEAQIAAWH